MRRNKSRRVERIRMLFESLMSRHCELRDTHPISIRPRMIAIADGSTLINSSTAARMSNSLIFGATTAAELVAVVLFCGKTRPDVSQQHRSNLSMERN